MRIALVQPPSSYLRGTPPLGLAYIGAMLEQHGHTVRGIDASAGHHWMAREELVEEVKGFRPDLVGITMVTNTIDEAYPLAQELSALGIPVVGGGPHANLEPLEALQYGLDIVCRGEGEYTMLELVEYVQGKKQLKDILGISYWDKAAGRIVANPPRPEVENIEELPSPARHLFPLSSYTGKGSHETMDYWTILSSRGCPKKCIYCSEANTGYRYRSAEHVYQELLYLKKTYGIRHVKFYDDVLPMHKRRLMELCDMVIDRKELDITWDCDSRVDSVTPDLLLKMKRAGCRRIYYGMESYDQETLTQISKGVMINKIDEAIRLTYESGIEMMCYLILGWPWETLANINNTIQFVRRLPMNVKVQHGYFVPTPYPGTVLYDRYKEQYGFQRWWVLPQAFEKRFEDGYLPYFRINMFYLDHFYMRKNFFKRDRAFQRFVRHAFEMVGRSEVIRTTGRKKGTMIIILSYLSYMLYRVHPKLERVVFGNFMQSKFKHLLKRVLFEFHDRKVTEFSDELIGT